LRTRPESCEDIRILGESQDRVIDQVGRRFATGEEEQLEKSKDIGL
jgi:hypothetical protein